MVFLIFYEKRIYCPVFCTLKWYRAMLFMILQKLHFCEKYDSPVLWYSFSSAQNALNQSECSCLWSTTSLGGVNIYLRILHRDNHKGKVESETTFFGWVWPVVPFIQGNFRIIWSSISLVRINWYFSFFYIKLVIKGK